MLLLMKTYPDVQDHRWILRERRHSGKGVCSRELVLQLHRRPDLQPDWVWRQLP
jgi:hypothetical protein